MKRIIQVVVFAALLGAASSVQADKVTITQVATGITDQQQANDALDACIGTAPQKTTLSVVWNTWSPECARVHWVFVRGDPNKQRVARVKTVMHISRNHYRADRTFAAMVNGFERQLRNGELDDDPYIKNLRARLPKKRVARDNTFRPPRLELAPIIVCVDKRGNAVLVPPPCESKGYYTKKIN